MLARAQYKSGHSGSKMQASYTGIKGALFSNPQMTMPPRVLPEDSKWHMNPSPPEWKYEATSTRKFSAAHMRDSTNMSSVPPPSSMDMAYMKAASSSGSPAYQPPPSGMQVNPSPYKWTGWF